MDELKEVTWQAPEFEYHHKTASWYWLSLIFAALFLLLALWQKNLLFALFVVIAEVMLIHWARRSPQNLRFKIDKSGVSIGTIKFYSYEELEGFHIKEETDEAGELILKTKFRLNPYVKISIEDMDAREMKNFLKKFLPEVEYEESFSDALGRKIGL